MHTSASCEIRLEDLLTNAENSAMATFGAAYRQRPAIADLAAFLAAHLNVELATDPAIVAGFVADESHLPGAAEAVCRPRSARDVAALLRTCRNCSVPVTVSAGRSNLTGSATPSGGVVLSLANLTSPALRVDAAAKTVEAPVGLILEDLRRYVREATGGTLCYPVDPTSRAEASVGGSIACNASGFTPGERGATRHWVEALDVVLPCGGRVRLRRGDAVSAAGVFRLVDPSGVREVPVPRHPRPAVKNAGGPFSAPDGVMDFIDLIVGGEGLFGVVVGCTLRLTERPQDNLDLFVSLPSEAEALRLRGALEARTAEGLGGFSAVEYFGANCRRFMKHEDRFFHGTDPVGVYLQVPLSSGTPSEAAEPWLEWLMDCGVALDPDGILLLDNDRDRAVFLEARHSMPAHTLEVVQRRGTYTLMTDTVVPPAAFAEFLEATHALLRDHALDYVAFGHLGDCHLHFTLLPEKTQLEQATRIYEQIVAKSAALGGVYSGEHGTGKRKRADFVACHGAVGVAEVRRTKAALDPEFLLNRGNVVTPP